MSTSTPEIVTGFAASAECTEPHPASDVTHAWAFLHGRTPTTMELAGAERDATQAVKLGLLVQVGGLFALTAAGLEPLAG